MKKETLLTIAVLVLIVLNVTLLVVFYVNQGRHPFMQLPPRGNEPGPGKVIIERLKLDNEQKKEFGKLKQEHQQKVRAIQEESRRLQDELFGLLKEPQQDSAKVRAIIDSIGNNRKELEQALFSHFASIKALCKTDEQKKLFDDFIDDLDKIVGPPMSPPPEEIPPAGPPPEK